MALFLSATNDRRLRWRTWPDRDRHAVEIGDWLVPEDDWADGDGTASRLARPGWYLIVVAASGPGIG
jgi:hypothetical protein